MLAMGALSLITLTLVITHPYQLIILHKKRIREKIKILSPALYRFATKRGGGVVGGVNLRPVPTAGDNFEFETIPYIYREIFLFVYISPPHHAYLGAKASFLPFTVIPTNAVHIYNVFYSKENGISRFFGFSKFFLGLYREKTGKNNQKSLKIQPKPP